MSPGNRALPDVRPYLVLHLFFLLVFRYPLAIFDGGVSIAQQALAAGLADEIVLHVVPKLIGRGVRLFDSDEVDLRCIEAIPGEGAVHLRYEVQR